MYCSAISLLDQRHLFEWQQHINHFVWQDCKFIYGVLYGTWKKINDKI